MTSCLEVENDQFFGEEYDRIQFNQIKGNCPDLLQEYLPMRTAPDQEEVTLYYRKAGSTEFVGHSYTGGPRLSNEPSDSPSLLSRGPKHRTHLSVKFLYRWRLLLDRCDDPDNCVLCCTTCRIGGKHDILKNTHMCDKCKKEVQRLTSAANEAWQRNRLARLRASPIEYHEHRTAVIERLVAERKRKVAESGRMLFQRADGPLPRGSQLLQSFALLSPKHGPSPLRPRPADSSVPVLLKYVFGGRGVVVQEKKRKREAAAAAAAEEPALKKPRVGEAMVRF